MVRPVIDTARVDPPLEALVAVAMEASTPHWKLVIVAVPDPAVSVADTVMLRCDATATTELNCGVVAMLDTGVKAVQTPPLLKPLTFAFHTKLGFKFKAQTQLGSVA